MASFTTSRRMLALLLIASCGGSVWTAGEAAPAPTGISIAPTPQAAKPTLAVGDPEPRVVEVLGRPKGKMKSGRKTTLFYDRGEITVEDGKVTSIGFTIVPALPPSAPATATTPPSPLAIPPEPYPKVKWPATREQLSAAIPDYDALEAMLKAGADRNGIFTTMTALQEQLFYQWSACYSGGGTAIARLNWEMGRLNLEVPSKPFDPENADEKANKYRCTKDGRVVFSNELPSSNAGISELWVKRLLSKGQETKQSGSYTIMTWGGTRTDWGKATWSPDLKRWVWKTPAERAKFFNDYEATLRDAMEKARQQAASSPDPTTKVTDIVFLPRAYEPHFLYRYLATFIAEYRTTPWPEDIR